MTQKENNRARGLGGDILKRCPPLWYEPTINMVALFKSRGKGGSSEEDSGKPDWKVFRPESKVAWVEFKAQEQKVDFSCLRDNQREWYHTRAKTTQTDYYIACWVSWYQINLKANHDKASFFWVPFDAWLHAEQMALDNWGIKTIYCLREEAPSTRRQFDLQELLALWALERREGLWWIPESHPIHPRGNTCHSSNHLTQTMLAS